MMVGTHLLIQQIRSISFEWSILFNTNLECPKLEQSLHRRDKEDLAKGSFPLERDEKELDVRSVLDKKVD